MNIQGEVFLVGGAVRDFRMGRESKDRDYVVVGGSIANLLENGFDKVGADFPVFLHPKTRDEYALARTERKIGTGYHGFDVVTEGVTLEDDLGRRDFTINAMAMRLDTDEVIDPYGGTADLENGVIRHVGLAFKEDPLRALRAARFAARYGFEIHPDTMQSIKEIPADDLQAVSQERIFQELRKAFDDGRALEFAEHIDAMGLMWMLRSITNQNLSFRHFKHVSKVSFDAMMLNVLVASGWYTDTVWSDFQMLSGVREVAKYVINMDRKHMTVPEMVRAVGWFGAVDSWKTTAYWNSVGQHSLPDQLWYIYHSVNANTVLTRNPTLQGRELGEAIFAARVTAFEKYLKGRQ